MVEFQLGDPGKAYAKWSAQMAVSLGTEVPWVMCKQGDAPDPIVRNSSLLTLQTDFSLFSFCEKIN